MSEDVIKVEIDDTEIDIAIAKLQMAMSLSKQTFDTPKITKGMEDLKFTLIPVTSELGKIRYRLGQIGAKDIPSINRELRILIGQLPMGRETMSVWFRLRRVILGLAAMDIQLALTVVATLVLIIKAIAERQKRIERRQQEYENYIRRERGLTHEQYVGLMATWQSYFRSRPG